MVASRGASVWLTSAVVWLTLVGDAMRAMRTAANKRCVDRDASALRSRRTGDPRTHLPPTSTPCRQARARATPLRNPAAHTVPTLRGGALYAVRTAQSLQGAVKHPPLHRHRHGVAAGLFAVSVGVSECLSG